jgi:hypothetical protein
LAAAVVMTLSLSPATLAAARWPVVARDAMIAAAFFLFAMLTVEVDGRVVLVRFGSGLLRKSVPARRHPALRCHPDADPVGRGAALGALRVAIQCIVPGSGAARARGRTSAADRE